MDAPTRPHASTIGLFNRAIVIYPQHIVSDKMQIADYTASCSTGQAHPKLIFVAQQINNKENILLVADIRKSSTLATFKKHFKTFLFCKHYGLVLEQ